jgi:hypothetical protein
MPSSLPGVHCIIFSHHEFHPIGGVAATFQAATPPRHAATTSALLILEFTADAAPRLLPSATPREVSQWCVLVPSYPCPCARLCARACADCNYLKLVDSGISWTVRSPGIFVWLGYHCHWQRLRGIHICSFFWPVLARGLDMISPALPTSLQTPQTPRPLHRPISARPALQAWYVPVTAGCWGAMGAHMEGCCGHVPASVSRLAQRSAHWQCPLQCRFGGSFSGTTKLTTDR